MFFLIVSVEFDQNIKIKSDIRKSSRFLESKSHQIARSNETTDDSYSIEKQTAAISQLNRRTKLFKCKQSNKCDILASSIISSEFVYHRGFYLQIGDVVALYDLKEKEMIYFAQIRAFWTDHYGSN